MPLVPDSEAEQSDSRLRSWLPLLIAGSKEKTSVRELLLSGSGREPVEGHLIQCSGRSNSMSNVY